MSKLKLFIILQILKPLRFLHLGYFILHNPMNLEMNQSETTAVWQMVVKLDLTITCKAGLLIFSSAKFRVLRILKVIVNFSYVCIRSSRREVFLGNELY